MGRTSQYYYRKWVILEGIEHLCETQLKNPAVREIANYTRIPVASTHAYIKQLAEEGLIEWSARSHRGISLTQHGSDSLRRRKSPQGLNSPF